MKIPGNSIIKLGVFTILILIIEFILSLLGIPGPSWTEMFWPTIVFFAITTVSLLIFSIGFNYNEEGQPMFSLAAIGAKFFLSACFALVYFIALKNTGLNYILLFFLLYLAFTFYMVKSILKILKIKTLK